MIGFYKKKHKCSHTTPIPDLATDAKGCDGGEWEIFS